MLANNLMLRSELEHVARAFRARGIEWVVLKGLPLAQRVYGSLADRFSIDNDILVRPRDVPRAMTALTEVGYVSAPGRTLDADREATFQHPLRRTVPSGVTARLELHWNAFPPHLFTASEAILWSRLETCELGQLRLTVFDPELTLVHLASHFVQHRCAEVRILEDIARALTCWRDRLDRDALAGLADAIGARAAVAFALRATWELGMTQARPLVRDWRADVVMRWLPVDELRRSGAPSYSRMALSLLLGAPERWPTALRHELFPHPSVLARIFAIDAPTRPHVWYLRRLARPLLAWRARRQRG